MDAIFVLQDFHILIVAEFLHLRVNKTIGDLEDMQLRV